jgi:hypothetical protein
MNYSKFSIPSLLRLAQVCTFGIALSAIALFSAGPAQAERTTPRLKPGEPFRPFPGLTNEVTPECKALMTSIKDMKYVKMNHTTIRNIRGKQSGGYSEGGLTVNDTVASGSGRQLLSDRYAARRPLPPDPNLPPDQILVDLSPPQPFDANQPEKISYSIDLATAKITIQNTKYQITSCSSNFAIVTTANSSVTVANSVEVLSFTQGSAPEVVN